MFDYEELKRLLLDDLGPLLTDTSCVGHACRSLEASFYKKLSPDGESKLADEAAETKFWQTLQTVGLREPSLPLDDHLLDQFRHNLWRLVENRCDDQLDLARLSAGLVPGPGVSLGQNPGSFFEKYFQGPISASSDRVVALFRACLMETPVWALAERQRYLEFGVTVADTSKGFFAKKNVQESRFCCTEPGVNMLFQLSIGRYLLERLRASYGIDLSTQKEKNMSLAQLYSMTDDGVTIDLTSASDSISVELGEQFLPPDIWRVLKTFRTSKTILPKRGEVTLPMISTMGNGFTFPLQCCIFACIVRTAYDLSGARFPVGVANGEWGVFGDDIIVPSGPIASKTKRLLHLLGFTVNAEKTFESGPFRESCGGDFYLGFNIRGVYIRSLETAALRYSAINRLLRWSATHGVLLRRSIGFILEACRGWQRYLLPRREADDAGIHVPESLRPDRSFLLEPVKRSREIGYDSPEYLGYNLALYTSFLGGYLESADRSLLVETDYVGPPTRIGYERKFAPPPLIVAYRLPQGQRPNYRRRTHRPFGWWDFPGFRDYDASWNAVVMMTLPVIRD